MHTAPVRAPRGVVPLRRGRPALRTQAVLRNDTPYYAVSTHDGMRLRYVTRREAAAILMSWRRMVK